MYSLGLLIFTAFNYATVATAASNNKIVCESDTKSITCPSGTFIQIRTINFGRTNSIICNKHPEISCYSSGRVTSFVASRCNGQDVCQLSADTGILGEDPCPSVPKYLDVLWDCDPLSTTSTTTTTTTQTPPVSNNVKPNQNQGPDVCHSNLVTGPHGVPDSHITASSSYSNSSNGNYEPYRGRLFNPSIQFQNGSYVNGGWSAKYNDRNQYIQVELNSQSIIRGVVTQGRNIVVNTQCCYDHVTGYTVEYSVDGIKFESVKDASGHTMVFNGNSDQETEMTNMFGCSIIAKYVRIRPVSWKNNISLRFEVLGCPVTTDKYGVCPNGWTERTGTDKCYLITKTISKTWHDARRYCRLQQGDLVVIDDVQENKWLRNELDQIKARYYPNNMYQVWLGLSNEPRKDSTGFKWTNGKPLDNNVVPWKKNMPDNYAGTEHCGEFVNSELNDVNCNFPINFVCEKDKYWTYPGAATTQTPPIHTGSSSNTGTGGGIASGTGSGSGKNVGSGTGSGTGTGSGPGAGSGTGTGSGSGAGSGSGGGTANSGSQTTRYFYTTKSSTTQRTTTHPINGKSGSNFYVGCKVESDCASLGIGYHQSCRGCSYVLRCLLNGPSVVQCPAGYFFDNTYRMCMTRSSTCS